MEVDVVVIGSGAAGLTSAVVAAKAGLTVLVTEKAAFFGGTTAYSLGAAWIIGNPHQPALGVDDNHEAGVQYLKNALGPLYDPNKVRAYVESGAQMVAFMEANTEVRWIGVPMPDYFPEIGGSRAGRTLLMRPYNGSVLGPYLRQIRLPLPGFAVFGSMQVDLLESANYKAAFKNWAGFTFTAKRMLKFVWDLARFGRGAYLANGNALIGRLMRSALDAKVELWRSAPATELIMDGNAVRGVMIERNGKSLAVGARKGVILASGGFGANPTMRAKYIPFPESHVSLQPAENVGDGLRLGQEAGGALGEPNPENGIWAPVSVLRRRDGSVDKYPHFGPDRGKPGCLIVDMVGKRFANEAAPYQSFVRAMHERGIAKAYFIGDRQFLRAYGMGLALPAPYRIGSFIRNGYLTEESTIARLAIKLGVESLTLESTIAEFNRYAQNGQDPQFHRGESVYDHSQGDFEHRPNPNLRPLGPGPYYAVTLFPGDVSTIMGLATNENAQVLNADRNAVPGLYAVGLDQNSFVRGVYPGGGAGIGPGMTFGYRAAMHLANSPAIINS